MSAHEGNSFDYLFNEVVTAVQCKIGQYIVSEYVIKCVLFLIANIDYFKISNLIAE